MAALEARHLADLQFAEVTRALRALSVSYVERRHQLRRQSALASSGKRAAYALFYSPLHFLTVERILDAVGGGKPAATLLDLGCGAGASGAAWASRLSSPALVVGVDTHPWALDETRFTCRCFGLRSDVRRANAAQVSISRSIDAVIAGWVVNELDDRARAAVRAKLLEAASAGVQVLVVEPIATQASPWWPDWARAFGAAGARVDEWRFRTELPGLVKRLDRAAGLRHGELTARSIYVGS
jgi:hypothetical protein